MPTSDSRFARVSVMPGMIESNGHVIFSGQSNHTFYWARRWEQFYEIGARNLANLISLGFDCISVSPNPQVWKKLMREGFLRFGNWCESTETALYASAPKAATHEAKPAAPKRVAKPVDQGSLF